MEDLMDVLESVMEPALGEGEASPYDLACEGYHAPYEWAKQCREENARRKRRDKRELPLIARSQRFEDEALWREERKRRRQESAPVRAFRIRKHQRIRGDE